MLAYHITRKMRIESAYKTTSKIAAEAGIIEGRGPTWFLPDHSGINAM